MPNENQCNLAREVTGSHATNIEINLQYENVDIPDRFILANSMEKLLHSYGGPIEEAWDALRTEFEDIAAEYYIDPATALCIYRDWKRGH